MAGEWLPLGGWQRFIGRGTREHSKLLTVILFLDSSSLEFMLWEKLPKYLHTYIIYLPGIVKHMYICLIEKDVTD